MEKDTVKKIDPVRSTSPEAIRLAKTLMRTARFGALAVLEPKTREPFVSRVAVATSSDGTPIILISSLSTHTQGLLANPSCSLLLGEPGKGDPLAHPRITLQCEASFLSRESGVGSNTRGRYLRRNPKGKLYADFGDFSFVKLSPKTASLNGGFGQAFRLSADDLLIKHSGNGEIESAEEDILKHMNEDHQDAVQIIGKHVGLGAVRRWVMCGVDCEGVDLISGDRSARAWFDKHAASLGELRLSLTELTKHARNP